MATSTERITQMYDELYKKKQAELEKAKNQSLTNLDAEKETTEKGYYTDKNKAYSQNVQNTQAIRDYMAKNNLLQSGENVDALLRSNSDLSNNVGLINDNQRSYNNNLNTRRTTLNNNYLSDLASAKADYEAQKQKDLLAYEQSLANASRGGSYSSGGGSGSSTSSGNADTVKSNLANEVAYSVNNLTNFAQTRQLVDAAYLQGYISEYERNLYNDRLNSTMNALKKSQASVNKGTYSPTKSTTLYNKNKLISERV